MGVQGGLRLHIVNPEGLKLTLLGVDIAEGQVGTPIDFPLAAGESKPVAFSVEQVVGAPGLFAAAVNIQKDADADPAFLSSNDPTFFDFTTIGLETALQGTITVQAPADAAEGLSATLVLVIAPSAAPAPAPGA